MICPLCSDHRTLDIDPADLEEHLIVTLDKNNHSYVHGPIEDKDKMRNLLLSASQYTDKESIEAHLVIIKDNTSRYTFHTSGLSVENKDLVKEFIMAICQRFDIGIMDE